MKKYLLLVSLLMGSVCFARPYFQAEFGIPTVASANKVVDNTVSRLSLGYEMMMTQDFSWLGEIGTMSGIAYYAGQNPSPDFSSEPLQLKLGGGVDGLLGLSYHLGRMKMSVLAGTTKRTLSINSYSDQGAISQSQGLGVVRLGYAFTPTVLFSISLMQQFGSNSPVTYDKVYGKATLQDLPSVTNVMIGVQLSL
jgi:hypothetical protein